MNARPSRSRPDIRIITHSLYNNSLKDTRDESAISSPFYDTSDTWTSALSPPARTWRKTRVRTSCSWDSRTPPDTPRTSPPSPRSHPPSSRSRRRLRSPRPPPAVSPVFASPPRVPPARVPRASPSARSVPPTSRERRRRRSPTVVVVVSLVVVSHRTSRSSLSPSPSSLSSHPPRRSRAPPAVVPTRSRPRSTAA